MWRGWTSHPLLVGRQNGEATLENSLASSHIVKQTLTIWPSNVTLLIITITLPAKVRVVKARVFPGAVYGSESWTIKKAEHRRTDAFKLWCWRRLLRVPCTARRSNQSILKEISPEYPLEGLMLKLKLQYFGHLMQKLTHWQRPWCWERLKAGKEEGYDRGWDGWMASPTQWTWVWANLGR